MSPPAQLDFDSLSSPATLAANRQGRLSERQAASLRREARYARPIRMIRAVGLLALAAVGGLMALIASEYIGLWLLPVFGLCALVAFSALRRRPWTDPLGEDVREGRVSVVSGIAHRGSRDQVRPWQRLLLTLLTVAQRFLGRTESFFEIGDLRFVVDRPIRELVVGAGSVRAYYLPRSMRLLSIERW